MYFLYTYFLIFFGVWLLTALDECGCRLTSKPNASYISCGEALKLTAITAYKDGLVFWQFQKDCTGTSVALYKGSSVSNDAYYSLPPLNDYDYTLTIKKVDASVVGCYTCTDNNGIGDSATASVNVCRVMKNEAVVVGSNVIFTCNRLNISPKCVQWFRYKYDCLLSSDCHSTSLLTYNTVRNSDIKYNHTYSSSNTQLFINTTDLTNANSYYCIELCSMFSSISGEVLDSSNLVMLASTPVCQYAKTSTSENSDWQFSCSVNVSGNWIPSFRWQTSEGFILTGRSTITIHTIPTQDFRKEIVVHSVRSELQLPGNYTLLSKTLTCTLYFDETGRLPSDVNATNVPSYKYVWTSPPVDILSDYSTTIAGLAGALCCLLFIDFIAIVFYVVAKKTHYKLRIVKEV